MRNEYVPNERIVTRAASLWRRMIEEPKFDNGDSSINGFTASSMASLGASMSPVTVEQLDAFEVSLKGLLMRKVTYKELDPESKFDEAEGHYVHSMHVDYGADAILVKAARDAGIKGNMTRFPWKTDMFVWNDYVRVSAGYGAETVYHYPLSDGKSWLVTRLAGSDIAEVIKLVEGGPVSFLVEVDEPKETAVEFCEPQTEKRQ